MDATIEKLWNGNIKPYNDCGADNTEIRELAAYMQRHRAALEQTLDKRQKLSFENYLVCAEERLYLITVHAFEEGFSLASKLMSAALREKK